MKKFGFSRSSKSSPAPSDNPYAQAPPAADPYANDNGRSSVSSYSSKAPSYTSRAPSIASQAPSYTSQAPSYTSQPPSGPPGGARGGLPSGPRAGGYGGGPPPSAAAQQPGSNGGPAPGYGSDRLGSGGGYGANRYKNEQSFAKNQNAPVTSQPFRAGGYGGLGPGPASRSDSPRDGPAGPGSLARKASASTVNTEVKRDDLFGGAQNRYDPQRGNAYDPATKPVTGYGQGGASGAGSGSYSGYGEERELTEEELAEQEVQKTMAETREIRDQSYQSTNRTLQQMYETVDVGRETLARLGTQGESLRNAERNMDMSENYNISGYDKAKELQSVNRSMFAFHVSNPFTAKKRAQARDEEVMDRHRAEKGVREATRAAHYSEARMTDNKLGGSGMRDFNESSYQRVPKDKNKFMFEDEDSEEEEKEANINRNLDEMYRVGGMLKNMAIDTGDIVDSQNRTIDRIAAKVSYIMGVKASTRAALTFLNFRRTVSTMVFGGTGMSWTRFGRALCSATVT